MPSSAATGLGLVALVNAEKVLPGTTSIEDLRKYGPVLLFMQEATAVSIRNIRHDGRIGHPPRFSINGEGVSAFGALRIGPRPNGCRGRLTGQRLRLSGMARTSSNGFWTLIASAEL
jgi:hypothetical protein